MGMHLDHIIYTLEGQGRGSKVKVKIGKCDFRAHLLTCSYSSDMIQPPCL